MTRRKPLTPEEIQGVLDDHAAGVPTATICARYSAAPSTIADHIKANHNIGLVGGRWVIDVRRRVLVWESCHPGERAS